MSTTAAGPSCSDRGSTLTSTHDPSRKLELFGANHAAESRREAREYQKAIENGSRSDQAANQDRLTSARATPDEVAAELSYYRKLIASRGSETPVTEADIQELIDRKRFERMIERKHALNLTSDVEGTRVRTGGGVKVAI